MIIHEVDIDLRVLDLYVSVIQDREGKVVTVIGPSQSPIEEGVHRSSSGNGYTATTFKLEGGALERDPLTITFRED